MDRLVAIALAVSAVSMFLSCAALWPHSQVGLSRARNGFLWMMFVVVVVGSATIGYRKVKTRRIRVNQTEFVSQERSGSRLPIHRSPTHSPSRGDRLNLSPRSGFASAPSSERLYQANYRGE